MRGSPVNGLRQRFIHQGERIEVELLGETFDRLQCHVALAALDRAHVCAVDTQEFGKLLLGESQSLSVTTEILPNGLLELSGHPSHGAVVLLMNLQTYE